MNNTDNLDPNGPETQIRTDLWSTMSLDMLHAQHALIVTKLTLIGSMMGPSANPSILGMYSALQTALTDIELLIDYRTTYKNQG